MPCVFPVLHHAAHDGGDVVDAAAADADGDARAGLQRAAKPEAASCFLHFGGDIGDAAVGKLLASNNKAGKLHDRSILAGNTSIHTYNGISCRSTIA